MNLLDLVLILAIVTAAMSGYRIGLVARVAGWIGFLGGLWLATVFAPSILRAVEVGSAGQRLLATVLIYLTAGAVGSGIGNSVGAWLRRAISLTPARVVDRWLGTAAGVLGLLVVVWLLAPIAAEVPGPIASQVRNSSLVQAVSGAGPSVPRSVQALRNLVSRAGFPEVFLGPTPAPDAGAPPEQLPLTAEQLERVVASTVAVESVGCGSVHEGSGWVVGDGLIVTNAHVVAGADDLQVRPSGGSPLNARVVSFDEDRDLALVEAPDVTAPALEVASAQEGQETAVVGYPRGQDTARPLPATVNSRRSALGRDIYGQDLSERSILVLAAAAVPGDSGSPVVDASGRVVGTVFAIAPDRPSTTYALDDSEIRALLDAPRDEGPGPCL